MRKSPSASLSGFIRFGLIRLIIPIALLIGGGQGLYTALTNRQPYSATFAEYIRTKPDNKWVELKETQLDMLGSISMGIAGAVSEVYIPMRVPGEANDAKIQALLLTKDPAVIETFKQLKALSNPKDMADYVEKNREQLFPKRTVSGLTKFGIDSDSKKRDKIAKLDPRLSGEFAVIEEGKTPELALSIVLLGLAVPAAWLCWFRRSK